jgi:hypothetical protein
MSKKPLCTNGFFLYGIQEVSGSIPLISTTNNPENLELSMVFGIFVF